MTTFLNVDFVVVEQIVPMTRFTIRSLVAVVMPVIIPQIVLRGS